MKPCILLSALVLSIPSPLASDRTQPPGDPPPPEPTLAPGKIIYMTFPDLPPTLFAMVRGQTVPQPALSLRLPDNYTPDRAFPLLVYLGPNDGGVGTDISDAIDIVGRSDYIVATFPLFRRSYDPNVLWDIGVGVDDCPIMCAAYRAMLERIGATVPNIDRARSILGGYSNGAQAIASLLSVLDATILESFAGFFLVDAGFDWSGYKRSAELGGHHILYLVGGGDEHNPEWWRADLVNRIRYFDKAAQFMGVKNWRFVITPNVGHAFPNEYDNIIREWAKTVQRDGK